MVMVYTKQIYPARIQPLGAVSGKPASGFFAMHITYPDVEYSDPVDVASGGWQYGVNSQSWRQGLTVIVMTPLATASTLPMFS